MKFGKVLKGKMKVAKMKGKAKKGSTGNESESVADDLVIESSKVSLKGLFDCTVVCTVQLYTVHTYHTIHRSVRACFDLI